MKRLVYNPKVDVFVKSDSGVYDLSPYVTSCTVHRKVNQISTAEVQFRNPQFIFTNNKNYDPITKTASLGPVFHPMDPIVIVLTRLRDRPIQVFTGFCDSTPYLQLYPGTCTIRASCTLKRLQYTYWDPGLPFVWDFLKAHGWMPNQGLGGITNPDEESRDAKTVTRPDGSTYVKQTDGSIGGLLFDVLVEICGWSEDTIYIEQLPETIVQTVNEIYNSISADSEEAQKDFEYLLEKIIGTASAGSGTEGESNASLTGPGGTLDNSWEAAVQEYSGNNYGVDRIINLYRQSPKGDGGVKGDRAIVTRVAREFKVPFALLWGCYGAESTWGTNKNASGYIPYFGLTADYPGRGTSGNFSKDARRSAEIWVGCYNRNKPKR